MSGSPVDFINDLKQYIPSQAINEAAWSNLPGKDGGPYDAYRHVLWLAEMTRRYGEPIARMVAAFHEVDGVVHGQSAKRYFMDQANNELGISLGKDAQSWGEVVERARALLNSSLNGSGPVVWLPQEEWRHSDIDPNPAPRNEQGEPLPVSLWNWPTPQWPNGPHPLPPALPEPVDGSIYESGLLDFSIWGGMDPYNLLANLDSSYFNEANLNPIVLDNAVDTTTLNPSLANPGENGVLGSGAGHTSTMTKEFVDKGGISHTASSGMVTDFVRPGNHSLANTDDILNALRMQANAWRESQRPLGAVISSPEVTLPAGFDSERSRVTTLTSHFDGSKIQVRAFFGEDGAPLGIQALESRSFARPNGSSDLESGLFYTFSSVAVSPDEVLFYGSPQAHEIAPVITIRNVADSDPYTDPLSLDADNDGVRLGAGSAYFDLNADGQPESLPWTAPTDPLLVMDVNLDGRISSGRELVDLTDAGAPLNLYSLDANGDKTLDAQDAAFHELQLWQDRNRDGYASTEERQNLADLGISSIDLDPTHQVSGTVCTCTGQCEGRSPVAGGHGDQDHPR